MTYQLVKLLIKSKDKIDEFTKVLDFAISSIKAQLDIYTNLPIMNNYLIIQNYLIFLLVVILNLRNIPSYIKTFFEGGYLRTLKKLFLDMNSRKRERILKMIYTLFFDEYKDYFFRETEDKEIQTILLNEQLLFSKDFLNTISGCGGETYKKMLNIVSNFDISYTNYFNNRQVDEDDRPAYKLSIAQGLIRVIFSKEKNKYISEENKFFEFDMLKKIIDKDMKETSEKFGDDYKTVFRKEDICDDFIKFMFFFFGNSMLIDSFITPLKTLLGVAGITDGKTNNRDISLEEYNGLMEIVIQKLKTKIPVVLKILLKLLYKSIGKYFTIDKENYSPLFTSLFFNYIINPKVQELYKIDIRNCNFIRSLNRLLRNTIYNSKFIEGDTLEIFNPHIKENHKKLKQLIKEQVIDFKIDNNAKSSLKNLFTEKYLLYPKFLFYYDSQELLSAIEGGVKENVIFEDITTNNTPED